MICSSEKHEDFALRGDNYGRTTSLAQASFALSLSYVVAMIDDHMSYGSVLK